jgi:cell division protein FtsL
LAKVFSQKIKHKTAATGRIRLKRVVIGALLVGFIIFMFSGNYGFYKMWQLHREIKQLEQELQKVKEQRNRLLSEKEKLLKDYSYIEKIAREKLGMARPNEDVYKFVPKQKEESDAEKD